jgi:hypothetical protein
MGILRRLGQILLPFLNDTEDEISLSDARTRMLKMLNREGKEVSRADVNATCIEPGKVPIRIVRGFKSYRARIYKQEPSADDLTAAFRDSELTRQDVLATLSDVRVKCRAIDPEASDIESAVSAAIEQILPLPSKSRKPKKVSDRLEVN